MSLRLPRPSAVVVAVLAVSGALSGPGSPSALDAQAAPQPQDEAAILETVHAVYAAMSANADEDRDWQAFHAWFLPEARLVSVSTRDGSLRARNTTVPEWIVASGLRLEGRGFLENVVHARVDQYGPIAQVLTSWVTRSERGGAENSRGAATLQLVRTDDGWRVASWIWTGEVDGIPLPAGAS